MKTFKQYIPFEYEMAGNERIDKEKMILRDRCYYSPQMDFANKQLAMYLSVAMQKVMEENPNAEIALSVKKEDNLIENKRGYVLRVVFGDAEEHDKIQEYMKICDMETH